MYDYGMSTGVVDPSLEASLDVSLEDELAVVAGVVNAQQARIVELTVRALADDDWQGAGTLSPAHWLTIQLGVEPRVAKRIVEIARRIVEFPVLRSTFGRGELSIDQVWEVTAKAPAWADGFITEFATNATVRQLRRMIRDEHFDGDPDDPDPAPAPESGERFSFGWDEHSAFTLSARGGADRGMLFDAAINEARDHLFRAGHTDVTWWDALDEMCRRSMSTASPERRDGFKMFVHVDTDSGAVNLSNGVPVPPAVFEYLFCSGQVQPVWERDHVPVGVGRSQRIVPDRLRRLVEYRDQGCRVPGCTATHVEVHHIVFWADGGPTDTWNLVSTCRKHHRDVHHGRLTITGNADRPDGLEFRDASGRLIDQHARPVPPTEPPPQPEGRYQHPSGERLDARWIDWTHPNARRRRRERSTLTDAEIAERLRESAAWRQRLWDRAQGRTWN